MKVGKYVKKQLNYIEKIDKNKKLKIEEKNQIQNSDYEEDIIDKLRSIYNESKFSKEELNTHSILLENKKLGVKFISFSGLITSTMAILISLMSISLSLYNNTSELVKFVNQLAKNINGTKDNVNLDIKTYSSLNDYIYWILGAFGLIIIGLVIYDGISSINEKRKKIAINIHKSVIKEKLEEMEKNEKEQVAENTKKLEEIEKIMEETKAEVGTLIRVFGGLRK